MSAPKILLIRLSSLGDIVLTTALITALREHLPDSQIDLVISSQYESIVPVLPDLSKVIVFNKRNGTKGLRALRRSLIREQYDYVLDLHNVLRTRILRRGLGKTVSVINKRTFRRWMLVRFKRDLLKDAPDVIGRYFEAANALGITDDGRAPRLKVEHTREARRIAIAPGARHWNKRWPGQYFHELSELLIARGYELTFYGGDEDVDLVEDIRLGLGGSHRSLIGATDLTDLAHSIAKCSLAITNDSGIMHVAQAVGTPAIAFFGPTVRQFGFAPRDAKSIVMEIEGLYCRPCTAIGMNHCPEKHHRCMREILPAQVMVSISGMLPETTT